MSFEKLYSIIEFNILNALNEHKIACIDDACSNEIQDGQYYRKKIGVRANVFCICSDPFPLITQTLDLDNEVINCIDSHDLTELFDYIFEAKAGNISNLLGKPVSKIDIQDISVLMMSNF